MMRNLHAKKCLAKNNQLSADPDSSEKFSLLSDFAITASVTEFTPASKSVRADSEAVAPVVVTSSISKIFAPRKSSGRFNLNAPKTFLIRSVRESVT